MSSSGPLRLSFGDSLPIHCAICKTGPCYHQRSFDSDTKALRASIAFSSAVPSLDLQITFFVDQEFGQLSRCQRTSHHIQPRVNEGPGSVGPLIFIDFLDAVVAETKKGPRLPDVSETHSYLFSTMERQGCDLGQGAWAKWRVQMPLFWSFQRISNSFSVARAAIALLRFYCACIISDGAACLTDF